MSAYFSGCWLSWDCRASHGSSIQLSVCQVSPSSRKRELSQESQQKTQERLSGRIWVPVLHLELGLDFLPLVKRDWDGERGDPKGKERLCDQSKGCWSPSSLERHSSCMEFQVSHSLTDLPVFITNQTFCYFSLWKLLIKPFLFSWNIAKVTQEK